MNLTSKVLFFIIFAILVLGVIFIPGLVQKDEETLNAFKIDHEVFTAHHPKTVDFTVNVAGRAMAGYTVEEVAIIWEIDENQFLEQIKENWRDNITLETKIEEFAIPREDMKKVKDIAESLL